MQKVAFITGASRGIGRAVARALAAEGYAVGINYCKSQVQAEALAGELTARGCQALAVQADVADREAVTAAVRQVEAAFGPVTLLVNNAGIARQHQFQDITPEFWRRLFAVNVDGAFHTIQAVLPHMIHEKAGCIINTSSIWGQRGASCEVAYSASKGAVNAFTQALARELAPSGIRVNAAAFGCIDTAMNRSLSEGERRELEDAIGAGRFGTADEAAALLTFLASPASSYINGQIVTMDGCFL